MLISFLKLTFTAQNKNIACEVDLTATSRYITNNGIQLVPGDVIAVNKLPYEDRIKLDRALYNKNLVVVKRNINFHDAIVYIDMKSE